MNIFITIAKNVVFFIGLVFSILLLGKNSQAIRMAARGKLVVLDD